MTPAEIAADLIAALADLYGWNVTETARLRLLSALRGFTRAEVSKVAADLARAGRGQLTISALVAALEGTNRAVEAGAYHRLDPEPDALDTVGIPTHPLDCECGGAGLILEPGALTLVDPVTGEALSKRRLTASRPCTANGGRRMTRQQYDRANVDARLTGRPQAIESWDAARDIGRAGVARARAALETTTDAAAGGTDPGDDAA